MKISHLTLAKYSWVFLVDKEKIIYIFFNELSLVFLVKSVVILFLLSKNNVAVQHTAFKAEN